MTSWNAFEAEAPELAAAGRQLLGGDGTSVAFLATVRKDGGPRVHPVMPVLSGDGLYVFVVDLSWKYHDLLRDGRYALHSAPSESGEEFYLTGPAVRIQDPALRQSARDSCEGRLGGHEFEALFELRIDRALHTAWEGWGTPAAWPRYTKWGAGNATANDQRPND